MNYRAIFSLVVPVVLASRYFAPILSLSRVKKNQLSLNKRLARFYFLRGSSLDSAVRVRMTRAHRLAHALRVASQARLEFSQYEPKFDPAQRFGAMEKVRIVDPSAESGVGLLLQALCLKIKELPDVLVFTSGNWTVEGMSALLRELGWRQNSQKVLVLSEHDIALEFVPNLSLLPLVEKKQGYGLKRRDFVQLAYLAVFCLKPISVIGVDSSVFDYVLEGYSPTLESFARLYRYSSASEVLSSAIGHVASDLSDADLSMAMSQPCSPFFQESLA